jgi:DNA-binding MarR family transcriptional regulator
MRTPNKKYPKKLLKVLHESGKELCLSEIARRTGITRFTAMRIISRLSEQGSLFEERRTPRYRYITLTDIGKTKLNETEGDKNEPN